MDVKDGHDLRCHCSRRPILCRYGVDSSGRIFVHVKAWKGKRLITEVVFTQGLVSIHCRECYRWTNLNICQPEIIESSGELPEEIQASMLAEPAGP